MKKKGSGDELVVFLAPANEQVIDALADRHSVIVAGEEGPAAIIEQCGFRRAHLFGRGAAAIPALELFKRRSDLVQSLAIAEVEPDDAADFRPMFELIDVPLLLLSADPFLSAMHVAVPTSQLLPIDLDDARALTRALWSHLLRARAADTQRLGIRKSRSISIEASSEAQALVSLLGHRGVRCFTSTVADLGQHSVPVAHDDVAIAMAQGHSLISGKTQAAVTNATPRVMNVPVLLLNNSTTQPLNNFETAVDTALAKRAPVTLPLPSTEGGSMAAALQVQSIARLQAPSATEASSDAVERAARLIAASHRPLIIAGELGRHRGGVEALVQLAQRHGIAVVEHADRPCFNFPTQHPLHLGFSASRAIKHADVILVIECDEPWEPEFTNLSHDPKIIRAGVDPRPADITLAGNPALTIRKLTSCLDKARPDRERIAGRVAAFASEHRRIVQQAQSRAIAEAARPQVTEQFLSYCIGEAIDDRVTIWSDSDLDPQLVPRRLTDSWFSSPARGWVLGAALGAQLANRDQIMLVALSDESYLAGQPIAAHAVANAKKLPAVIIVFNDDSLVKCEAVAESCGAKGVRVDNPRELPAAIRAALQTARGEKRQVLLNVCVNR